MNDFKENVKKWVELDNKAQRYKSKMDDLKKEKEKYETEKNKLGETVLSFMKNNKLEDNEIVISDGNIKYFNSKSSTSISQKFIQERLKLYFKNESRAKEVTEFIYTGREVSFTPVLKRTTKKVKD